ncbi:MAG: GIY-YIG nuclease family protein, partial [Candidatus Marinimicrobia bacterium]|nr:GIY-YIG nuclease family protein [Candidatus Neomarinimicrobiota bacterium]
MYRNKNGKVIYVGKAKNLRDRVRSYFREGGKRREAKIIAIQKNAVDVETIVTNSEVEALILENNLIKEHRPRYNVLMKDDKTFPYICITKELLPRIFITRKIEKNGSQYFGPYTNAYALREMMKIVEKVFTVRSCNQRFTLEMLAEKKVKLCLDYHIKKCDGPCENLISPAEYAEMLTRLRKFLNGDSKPVVQFLQVEMKRASENLRFEDAARFRDQIQMAKNFYKKQQVELLDNRDRDVIALSRTTSDERRMSNGKGASKYEISNTQHSTFNTQHSTFNTQHSTFNTQHSTLNIQHSTFNTRESACITMFRLRQGKLLSRETVILPDVSGQSDSKILASFCGQFYLESDLIPKEINVQTQPKDAENLKKWLTEKRKNNVK